MKVLITGGAGFLGLHLAHKFSRKGHKVTLLDISEIDKKEYPKNCIFIKADIRSKKLIEKSLIGQDVIIHAAAALPLWKRKDILDINVRGTKNLLESAVKNKIKHFIYISSTAVYGVPKKHPVYENDPRVGVGPYGESKIKAEELCEKYRGKGMIVTVVRPKTFIGTARLGVFEILFDWVHDGVKIPVVGNGKNRYQLLDVDDLVNALYLMAVSKSRKKLDDNFNIGADEFNTVEKDLGALFKFAKSGSKLLRTPALPIKFTLRFFEALNLSPLYAWVYETADKDSFVSIEKLKKALNWKPKYSNSEAFIKSYKWYLKHYKDVKKAGSGVTHTVGWKQGVLGVFKRFL